ncbi:L,D-transpeptidase family protein [Streptomyces sp. NPDC005728]|uniref:L,D-transpeptidase family protein n=1 Tax=Streptomyces sp. NPDC005728 TaxID=3157054 RepID=UPI0033CE4E11
MSGVWRVTAAVAACGTFLATLSACGGAVPGETRAEGAQGRRDQSTHSSTGQGAPGGGTTGIPGVGERLYRRIPAVSRQVVAVYGEGSGSADSTVVLYTRQGAGWRPAGGWPAHNGRNGWTLHHRMGDERSPVGVFTLSDAGGVLADPGTRLPYDQDAGAYAPPAEWDEAHQHDFDYVIAIDYNRLRGTPPHDPTRPEGEGRGGGIWLHLDHGSGTSACVSLSKEVMRYLLHTLDPALHPVVVMGDREELHA